MAVMNARKTSELLEAYLDGELSPAMMLEVERELAASAPFAALLAELKEMRADIASAGEPHISEAKMEGFAARVREAYITAPYKPIPVAAPVSPFAFSLRRRTVVGSVAAIVLVMFLSFSYGFSRGYEEGGGAIQENGLRIYNVECNNGGDISVHVNESENYGIVRFTNKEPGNVVIHKIETAVGIDYDLEVDPHTGDATIRFICEMLDPDY